MTLELTGPFKLLLAILTILALALIAILGGSLKYWREKRNEPKEDRMELHNLGNVYDELHSIKEESETQRRTREYDEAREEGE